MSATLPRAIDRPLRLVEVSRDDEEVLLEARRGGNCTLPGAQSELAQALLTALLAPVVCSVQVLLWRRLTPDDGR